MIYFIDQSIADEFSNRSPTEKENLFFQELAASYRHGYCYLCGNFASIRCLQTYQDKTTKDIYNAVQSHYAESGAAINSVQKIFVLTYQRELNKSHLPETLKNKCCFIYIPMAINSNWKLNHECCLLTENLQDGEFYLFIGKHYCERQNIPYRQIHFHQENGGGDTTCRVFEKCILQDAVPVLCIVDSDQKHGTTKAYPNRPAIGETLHHLQKKEQTLSNMKSIPPHILYPLCIHEVENLVPSQLIKAIGKKHVDMEQGIKLIIQMQYIKNGESLLYYDYKKGFPYIKEEPKRAYWREILLALGGDEEAMPPSKKAEGMENPKPLFFPPVSGKLLQYVMEKAKDMENENAIGDLQIDNYLKEIWENIGMLLLTWGYVNDPLRA